MPDTIVSATRAAFAHAFDVVHPHHVGSLAMPSATVAAVPSSRSCGGSVEQNVAERRFAGRAQKHRTSQQMKRLQMSDDLHVVLQRLAETEARIDDDPSRSMPAWTARRDRVVEKVQNVGHDRFHTPDFAACHGASLACA